MPCRRQRTQHGRGKEKTAEVRLPVRGGDGEIDFVWACVTGQPGYGLGMSSGILCLVVFRGG